MMYLPRTPTAPEYSCAAVVDRNEPSSTRTHRAASCATNLIAFYALFNWARGIFNRYHVLAIALIGVFALSACSTPKAPTTMAMYDFGPLLGAPSEPAPGSPVISLGTVEAPVALESTTVLYRLAYADVQQLRPYAQARWSMPPAQLLRLRLRDALSAHSAVLPTQGADAWILAVELDEFSHLFDSATRSAGIVRLQATLRLGDKLIAQRSVFSRSDAASQDAPGGVRALTVATDDAVKQLAQWVAQHVKPR
jgi:cholesterol transport system auxiliary component